MSVGGEIGEIGRWFLDTDVSDFTDQESVVDVRGWISLDAGVPAVAGPFLVAGDGVARPLHRVARPDVARALPGTRVLGFDEVLALDELARSTGALVIDLGRDRFELELPLAPDTPVRGAHFVERKTRKLERIAALLACPVCRAPLPMLVCSSCGYAGQRLDYAFALAPEGVAISAPEPPFSANVYAGDLREFLSPLEGGLVLDAGSGLRYEYFDDIVNFEIDAYPTTDVVGSGEALPFVEASFDGVISIAVLEHVPDARACVAELARVLRPGGAAYIAVPFLQPYHGYPNHFSNWSQDGLATLFAPYFEIDELTTPDGGRPIYALSWILDSYRKGLPPEIAARFGQMTVDELAGDPERHVWADYVTDLAEVTRRELASFNLLRGRRRS